jgi:hypothetical protein
LPLELLPLEPEPLPVSLPLTSAAPSIAPDVAPATVPITTSVTTSIALPIIPFLDVFLPLVEALPLAEDFLVVAVVFFAPLAGEDFFAPPVFFAVVLLAAFLGEAVDFLDAEAFALTGFLLPPVVLAEVLVDVLAFAGFLLPDAALADLPVFVFDVVFDVAIFSSLKVFDLKISNI